MNSWTIREISYIKNSQNIGLSLKNDYGPKLFWKDFNRLIAYYPRIKNILINEYNIMMSKQI